MNIGGVWIGGRVLLAAGAGMALAACAVTPPPGAAGPSNDLSAIEADLASHIAVLASDEFGGRAPGTAGETLTLEYLIREWQAAGLEGGTNNPANPWLVPVTVAGSVPAESAVRFYRAGRQITVPDGAVVAYSSGRRVLLDKAPLLFVGKQFRELDRSELTGRVAVMLQDHPDHSEQREMLLERGASAVLAIVPSDSELSGIVAQRRSGSYRLGVDGDGSLLDGYMTLGAALALFGKNGLDLLKKRADQPGFKPTPLSVSVSIEATATSSEIQTHNLIARLPGSRPDLGAVLLAAHWDHFGTCADPPAQDLICNGAVDNASGLAVLTELARRLAAGPQQERDVYFLATTAEEWALLGARAFADDPPIPLPSIVAGFNVDSIAIAPRGAPVVIVGAGLTPLDAAITRMIAAQGRKLGDAALAANFLRRQDGWVLLQRDVPTLMVSSAFADWARLEPYTADRYHLPSDRFEGIELGGAAQDLLLHLDMVRFFASSGTYPPPAGHGAPEEGE